MTVTTNKAKGASVGALLGGIIFLMIKPYLPDQLAGEEGLPLVEGLIMVGVPTILAWIGAYLPKYAVCHPAAILLPALLLLGACTEARDQLQEWNDAAVDKKAELAADAAIWQCSQSVERRQTFVDLVDEKLAMRGSDARIQMIDCDGDETTPQ